MFPTWWQWQIYKGGLASTVINDEGEISPSSWNKKIKNENLRAPTMEHVRRGCRPSHTILPPSVGHTSRRPQVEPAVSKIRFSNDIMSFSLSFLHTYITYVAHVAASFYRIYRCEPEWTRHDGWQWNQNYGSDNEQILAMPELNKDMGVPEWNEAMGMPEWDGAESSDSISVDSLYVLD